MSNLTPAEQKVRRLARLPGNTECPNCGLQKKFGFSTICIKFGTFVCNECKSSHQAISHRCKSLTMSSWDMSEADQLERTGNDHARNTWLQNAPSCGTGGRPQPGSDISVYKNFVVNAYERRKYYGESSEPNSQASSTNSQGRGFPNSSTAVAQRPLAPVPTPAPVSDLLDFGSSFADSSSAPATTAASGDDDFGSFQGFSTQRQTQSISRNGAPSIAPPSSFDPFSSAPMPVSFSSTTGRSSNAVPAPVPPPSTSFGDFDAFATSRTTANNPAALSSLSTAVPSQPPTTGKKPIMGSNASSAISNMNFANPASSIPQLQQHMVPKNMMMVGQSSLPHRMPAMIGTLSPGTTGAFMNPTGAYAGGTGSGFDAPMMMQQPYMVPQPPVFNGMTNQSLMFPNASPSFPMGTPSGQPGNRVLSSSTLARPGYGTNQSQNGGATDKFADLCKF